MAQDKAQVCLYGSLTNRQKESAANTLVQHRRSCTRKAESHIRPCRAVLVLLLYKGRKKSKPPARKAVLHYVNGNFLNVVKSFSYTARRGKSP